MNGSVEIASRLRSVAMEHQSPDRTEYSHRVIDADLDALFGQLPAILLDGPKGVGKTATAQRRCVTERRLDNETQRLLVEADPSIFATDPKPLLIDEWHRVPTAWDAIRRLVDADPSGGQFLLTGSAPARSSHSGAGRIASLRMRPMCLEERQLCPTTVSFDALRSGTSTSISGRSSVTLADYTRELVAGGFPGMRRLDGRALQTQMTSYINRIVDHDLAEAGYRVRRPAAVRGWLRAYAAATATTATWETIRDAATGGVANKPAKTTTAAYTELLTELRILDPIEAWAPTNNHLVRLTGAPKHHLADPALAARLLQRTERHLLTGDNGTATIPRDGTLLGNLFESLVALSIRTYAQSVDGYVYHLRTEAGRNEVDFIVEVDGGVLAFEAKLNAAVTDADVRHLIWLRDRIGDDLIDAAVITAGPDAYRRTDGIAVIPLALLGR